jgi:hypothetical protein
MRASGRIVFSLLALLFFLSFSFPIRHACAQSANPASSQISAQAAVPSQALPTAWSDGVKGLTEKIAAAVKPARAISLEVKNISSLSVTDVEAIQKGIEADLSSHGLRIGSADADVEVTISENADGYVWVAETRRNIRQETSTKVAIVSVPKTTLNPANDKGASLVLSKRLIWEQPTQFLDFLVFERPTTVMSSDLVVLEPERLVYYRSTSSQWQPLREIPFPHLGYANRTFHGRIDTGFQKVWGPGGECSGDLTDPDKVKCSSNTTILAGAHVAVKIPDHETYQAEVLSERCGEKSVALVSGNGDWTQPDSLQGYLFNDVVRPDAVPAGGSIGFDGPIMSILADDRESVRLIVRNLKTGNYEGYVVTATCSQ